MNLTVYRETKQRYPNMLLLFRLGQFYELYGQDAEIASKLLRLALTTTADQGTGEKVLMAAFPHQDLEKSLRSLLRAGHRVAICERAEESAPERPQSRIQPTLFDLEEES